MSIFTKPENFFKGREFTERVRKNFAMVSKVIQVFHGDFIFSYFSQKVAEGAEFVDLDPMKVCNNFVKVNKDRMEQYFKDVSCHPASNPIGISLKFRFIHIQTQVQWFWLQNLLIIFMIIFWMQPC